jgi:hypothetical protein
MQRKQKNRILKKERLFFAQYQPKKFKTFFIPNKKMTKEKRAKTIVVISALAVEGSIFEATIAAAKRSKLKMKIKTIVLSIVIYLKDQELF